MADKIIPGIRSEIDKLETVIVHTPGSEVENMTPANAERALYSDILNLPVALEEYRQFKSVLDMYAGTLEVSELLRDVLDIPEARKKLITNVCDGTANCKLSRELEPLENDRLALVLIQGLPRKNNTLTNFLSDEKFSLMPLHNFFFTRDSASIHNNCVLISKMASQVRAREAGIMEVIFTHHPLFSGNIVSAANNTPELRYEGGDILTAREDILVIGKGLRTSSQGIDFLIDNIKKDRSKKKHILVQELPSKPESFIHLDMVFTFLDRDQCMVYEPLILKNNKYQTVRIDIENGKVSSIDYVDNLLSGLSSLGMDLAPLYTGGKEDLWMQEREQWHSGANFFAMGPGQILGYERNQYTMDELNRNGYDIVSAEDIINGKTKKPDSGKFLISMKGSELARGGGGARCMTMPVKRSS